MNIIELQKLIIEKNLPNLLILSGEEVGIKATYIHKIVGGHTLCRKDTISECVSASKRVHLGMKNIPVWFLVQGYKSLLSNEEEIEMLKSGIRVILTYEDIDKRSKLYKEFQKDIVVFDFLTSAQLSKYILKELDLPQNLAELLALSCGNNFSKCMNDIDKVKQYAKANDISHTESFKELVNLNALSFSDDDTFTDFINSVMAGNTTEMFKLWDTVEPNSELKAVAYLYNNFRALYLISSRATADLNPYIYHSLKPYIGKFGKHELREITNYLQQAEAGVKYGVGTIDLVIPMFLSWFMIKFF